jgi:hypothetical protein
MLLVFKLGELESQVIALISESLFLGFDTLDDDLKLVNLLNIICILRFRLSHLLFKLFYILFK